MLLMFVMFNSIVIALRFWNSGITNPIISSSIEAIDVAVDSLFAVVAVQLEDGARARRGNVTPADGEDDTCVDEDDTPAEEELEECDEETLVVAVGCVDVMGMAVDLEELADDRGDVDVGESATRYTPTAATTMTMTMIAAMLVLIALPFLTPKFVKLLMFPREILANIFAPSII